MIGGAEGMRIWIASTPVAPLGDPRAGGVTRTIGAVAAALDARGHHVTVVAPVGSEPVHRARLITVPGGLQRPAQDAGGTGGMSMPADPVLEAMWLAIRAADDTADIVINCAYDWLPFALSPFLTTPVAHLVSMAAEDAVVVAAIHRAVDRGEAIAVHSVPQMEGLGLSAAAADIVGIGLDLDGYPVGRGEIDRLIWAGRLAPEKRPGDAVAVAAGSGFALVVCGEGDRGLIASARRAHPAVDISLLGQLDQAALARELGSSRCLLMTPGWEDASPVVTWEALACGTPVVAYARGGLTDEVVDGVTGFLVPPDDIDALVDAVRRIAELDRRACRRAAEDACALDVFGERLERWLSRAVRA